MPWKSNIPAIKSRHTQGVENGLLAAAAVLEAKVKEGLKGGYTSGRFVTGHVMASVNHSDPTVGPNGAYILVGTDVMYALFWEIGHQNRWTRKFERVEVWMPAFLDTRSEQMAAFQRVYRRTMGGGSGGSRVAASPRSPDSQ
jgi:hypothetical protein